ncbi:Kinesin- protein 6 [Clydaea vesicula]|uniref:Kinesin-like protein n=1 Tax=Clydaea vesicula TaxID=447962 RepID=A0AAD5U6G2_9FUNG|nr:Kinesin- protein 6 [Clydaea vesicula]
MIQSKESSIDNTETDIDDDNSSTSSSVNSTIKIYARIRPPRAGKLLKEKPTRTYEINTSSPVPLITFKVPKDESQGLINNQKENHDFKFERIFESDTKQEEIFDVVAKDVVTSVLDGYNGTIFAYGQTGSGKTFTITGGAEKYSDRGLIPRTIQYMFKEIQNRPSYTYEFKISYLEIYNEAGYDLLDTNRDPKKLEDLTKVTLLVDSDERIHLRNLSVCPAANEEEALNLLFVGDTNKMIAETPSNPQSSRSHCIFIISCQSKKEGDATIRKSKLHLVDLAGSERVSKTQINGSLLTEARCINLSLHFLEQVIIALHQKSLGLREHIPYRNSMMTSVLKDSIGGNCKTTMIATASVEESLIDESIATCRFAQRVALISNKAKLNEELDPQLLIIKLKKEIVKLKAEIAILRGGENGGEEELPDYEVERVKKTVDEYILEKSESASMTFTDFRKISCAYRFLKNYILQKSNNGSITSSVLSNNETSVNKINTINFNEKEYIEKIEKLKHLVSHRDNEINILVSMINKEKLNKNNEGMNQHQPHILTPSTSETSLIKQPLSSKPSTPTNYLQNTHEEQEIRKKENANNLNTSLTADKAKAFEIFKSGYPAGSWIDGQKLLLKQKYVEAKSLGEKANAMRNEIKILKGKLAVEESNEEEKEVFKDQMTSVVSKYKISYQQLKDMKIEIEHLHHLLDQARLRLTRDFEHWFQSVYMPISDEDNLKKKFEILQGSSSQLSREDSGKELQSAQIKQPTHFSGSGNSLYLEEKHNLSPSSQGSIAKSINSLSENAARSTSRPGSSAGNRNLIEKQLYSRPNSSFGEINSNNIILERQKSISNNKYGSQSNVDTKNFEESKFSNSRPSSRSSVRSIPARNVTEDIEAFYKARDGMMKNKH